MVCRYARNSKVNSFVYQLKTFFPMQIQQLSIHLFLFSFKQLFSLSSSHFNRFQIVSLLISLFFKLSYFFHIVLSYEFLCHKLSIVNYHLSNNFIKISVGLFLLSKILNDSFFFLWIHCFNIRHYQQFFNKRQFLFFSIKHQILHSSSS